MRQYQQRRDGWLEANAHLGPQYRQVVRTLAWQRRATGLAVEQERPGYALEALGPVPASTRGRRAWRQAAAEIEHYRRSYQITDPDRRSAPSPTTGLSGPTGSEPVGPSSGSMPSNGPPTAPTMPSRPASAPASHDLTSSVADEARSGPPASTNRKEHPNGQFWTVAFRRTAGRVDRCGRSVKPTCRPSSPTSPATPTNCWPIPVLIGRW